MNSPNYRIPDEIASEVLAEAARLTMETTKGYSLNELQQAGLEAQIPLETIERAIKIVEERRQAEQLKQQQAREQFKQRIKKYASVGATLLIPVALVSGILVFLPRINTFIQRPDLQSQIQELEKQHQQTQNKLADANYRLRLHNQRISELQQEKNQLIEKINKLQQGNSQVIDSNIAPEPGIMFRDDFAQAVVGKTKQQVIQAVGKPDETSDSGEYSHWYYNRKTKDRITGNVDSSVSIFFVEDIADKVNSHY